jgi:hypothetical protein
MIAALAVAAVVVAAFVALALTPFGGWVQSLVGGTGVRWAEAYQALDAAETNLPRNARERERLLRAWAMVEDEPPAGLTGPRIHRPGTLAHLRYQAFDGAGQVLEERHVRALVPPLPAFANDRGLPDPTLGKTGCPAACQTELARTGGLWLQHSGHPGLAPEWVLRMPVGQAFSLGARTVSTHDVLSREARPLGSRGLTQVTVTLLEACPARIRVGAVTRLEFHTYVPIPLGFETVRWVQLDGCAALLADPRPGAAAGAITR